LGSERNWNDRKQWRVGDGDACVEGRIGVQSMTDVVLKIVMDAECRTHRPPSIARRIPREADTWLPESFGIIFEESGPADVRLRLDDVIHIHVIGSVIVLLVPTVGHFFA